MAAVAEGPDVISYNAVISCFEKASNWFMALEMLAEMLLVKIRQSGVSFSAAISACEKGSQWRRALYLLKHMQQLQLLHDVMAFNAAIGACHKATKQAAQSSS
eukprot:Skav202454  [mRNA]  locus=scaffold149:132005:132780:+ [translate_table: standard]